MKARPLSEWYEEIGPVLWWIFPITEPPYVGTPLDCGKAVGITVQPSCENPKEFVVDVGGWPGYHTHWTPIECPEEPT